MSTEIDGLALSKQSNIFSTNQPMSDGEEKDSEQFGERRIVSPKMQKKKAFKLKRGRNYDSSRSLTDPNLKNLNGINVESTSDSTPNVSEWNPNLPPSGLSRSKSPRPSRSSKSPSSDQIFTDVQDSGKSSRPAYQQSRPLNKIGNNASSSSLPLSPSPSPLSLSIFRHSEGQKKHVKEIDPPTEPNKKANSADRGKAKPRLLSLSSCHNDQEALKCGQSPASPKSPFGKIKSFKEGLTSPDHGKNKFLFYPNYATVSSKKRLARLRNYSLPSEHFTLKFDAKDPGELIPSPPGQTLGQAIHTSVVKRGLTMNMVEVYLDSSKTPLPMSSDTFLLANNVLWVKVREATSKRSSTTSNSGSRKRQSSLTRFKKILTSMEDIRVSDAGDSQKVKVNHKGRLHSLLGSFSKQQDKHDQLNELLDSYSRKGLPRMPYLLTLGRPTYSAEEFKLEKHWSEVVSRDRSSSMEKHERDQQEALWELMVTEVEYIEKLQVITDLFVCCLINLQNDLILNEIEVDKLCSNIVDVYYASCYFWTAFLSEVIKRSRDTGSPLDPTLLKQGFLLFDKIFEPYKKYCLEQEVCRDYTKNRLKDNELFRLFIQWAESQPQCKRLKLTDLIISPFQRLTRYKLLLYAIQRPIIRHLKALPHPIGEDRVDNDQSWAGCLEAKKDIDVMVEQVEKFVHQVNVAMRLSQDHQQLSQIVDKIDAYEIVEPPNEECAKLIRKFSHLDLTMPMQGCGHYERRSLIMEGSLKLKDNSNKFDVQCYLFTDMLLITRSSLKRSEKLKFKVIKPPMRLDKIVACELKDGGSFMIIHLNEFHLVQSALYFFGDSKLWIEAVTKAQKDYKEKRRSFSRKSDLSHALDLNSLSLYEDQFELQPLTSRASNASLRSASVSEPLMRHDGLIGDASPIASLAPTFRFLDFRDGDDDYYDDDCGMFPSIIEFASKRSIGQQTSDGLAKRSCSINSSVEVRGHERSFQSGTHKATPLRRNKSTTDSTPLGATLNSELRSRSSDDVTPNDELALPVSNPCRQDGPPERSRCSNSMSKSLPDVLRGDGDDDDDDDDENANDLIVDQSEGMYCRRGNEEEDDVSVFSGSFRTRERDFDNE